MLPKRRITPYISHHTNPITEDNSILFEKLFTHFHISKAFLLISTLPIKTTPIVMTSIYPVNLWHCLIIECFKSVDTIILLILLLLLIILVLIEDTNHLPHWESTFWWYMFSRHLLPRSGLPDSRRLYWQDMPSCLNRNIILIRTIFIIGCMKNDTLYVLGWPISKENSVAMSFIFVGNGGQVIWASSCIWLMLNKWGSRYLTTYDVI